MTKPPFKMPQRSASPAQGLDRWVAGEEGTATPTPEPQAYPKGRAGKASRLTIDLPADLHAKFKATCALKGTRMIDEVRKFIEGWTQKNG